MCLIIATIDPELVNRYMYIDLSFLYYTTPVCALVMLRATSTCTSILLLHVEHLTAIT